MAQEWSCPQCGKKNPSQLSACGWCRFAPVGLEQPAPPLNVKMPEGQASPIVPSPSAPVTPDAFRCPHCGEPNAQRVSGIVRQDIRTGTTVGGYVGGSYGAGIGLHAGTIATQTSDMSILAQLLAAPAEPPPPAPVPPIGLLFLGGGVIAIFVGAAEGPLLLGTGGMAFAIGVGVMIFEHFQNLKNLEKHEPVRRRWAFKLEIWKRLNYCRRCDSVYDPKTCKHASSTSWHSLLNECP